MWESNPPRTRLTPNTGFEDQGAHQLPYHAQILFIITERGIDFKGEVRMEKESIHIRKIKGNEIWEKEDEVAIEYQVSVLLKNGKVLSATCTPTYLEEMILGKRFLAGDLTECDSLKFPADTKETADILTAVSLEEIFQIAQVSFENPGPLFVDTGCAHSCALIHQGKVLCCIEDIGRHNALDKVIGFAVKNQIPFYESYIFTSGRISGDYIQKVIDAGFPMAVSRAAVTSQAVELAKKADVTMLGFIRKNTGNIYWEGKVALR